MYTFIYKYYKLSITLSNTYGRGMESKNKELKIKSFRVDEETFEKFKNIASSEFKGQGQCLEALINLYELENSKASLVERKLEIESFQDYLNKINQLFLTSLQMSKDAEVRFKDEYIKQLNIKNKTIEGLQNREKQLFEKIKFLETSNKELTFFKGELEKDKSTLSQLVSRNHDTLESNRREIEKLKEYKKFKIENEGLKKENYSLKEELNRKINESKNKASEIEIINREVEFLKNRIDELKKEVLAYKELASAIKNEHSNEIEILEKKYNKIIEKETKKLTESFNKELELEKKSFALNLKILEEEKRILELQLKNLTK